MFYKRVRAVVGFLLRILFGYSVEGRENIPEGGFMVCANHSSYLDPAYLALALDTSVPVRFMAKASLFKIPLLGRMFRKLGAFPVHRNSADLTSLKTALRILKEGQRLIIFPEGTRFKPGESKGGAAMLALRSGCRVLPVYIAPGKRIFKRIDGVIGKPFVPASKVEDLKNADYQKVSDEIMRRILALAPPPKRRKT